MDWRTERETYGKDRQTDSKTKTDSKRLVRIIEGMEGVTEKHDSTIGLQKKQGRDFEYKDKQNRITQ